MFYLHDCFHKAQGGWFSRICRRDIIIVFITVVHCQLFILFLFITEVIVCHLDANVVDYVDRGELISLCDRLCDDQTLQFTLRLGIELFDLSTEEVKVEETKLSFTWLGGRGRPSH